MSIHMTINLLPIYGTVQKHCGRKVSVKSKHLTPSSSRGGNLIKSVVLV